MVSTTETAAESTETAAAGVQVSRKALYVVKDCKTMLNRLTTRVAKLKQVLEDILNDDQEMEDMYLGRRAGGLPVAISSSISVTCNCILHREVT